MTSTKKNGFVYSGVSKSQVENRSPIYGYQDLSVTSLDESVGDVTSYVPCIETYVHEAKQNCYKGNPKLTLDESAAIYLYTMPKPFHNQLNNTLRTENRDKLKPWLAFLKLFITALRKLPTLLPTTVWRGVASDLSSNFVNNPLQTWWTVNSCSKKLEVVERYLGGISTVLSIKTIHGKDISLYSAFPSEHEVVLMPGTHIQVMSQLLEANDKPYIVSLEECTTIPQGKHVMLSYQSNDHKIVSEICQILQKEHITVWFEGRRDLEHNIRNSMADGVENAEIVCCFITPDYAKSIDCQCELQYARKRGRRILPCLLKNIKSCQFSDWLERIIKDLKPINLHDISKSNIQSKTYAIIYQIENELSALQYLPSRASDKPSYLFELIRQKYQRNSRIERIMNPSKSFPIEQSYINLAIVNSKEHQEKEKQLLDAQHGDTLIGAYEEIYGMKTVIDVKNIFDTCKNQEKQVLVFGRAGIGKSTFCRYIAYQWAARSYWSQYELLALIPLRRLTSNRYPSDKSYSLFDLVRKEVFQYDLSERDDILLKNQFDPKKTLWILDGYDEIVQNVPPHLQILFEQLLKTPHHILTSRPYMNTLSYNVQMEITGFKDENIKEYVQQFFAQMKDEFDNTSIKSQTLIRFLKSNSSIWGIAHIPINLELICSCWSNEDWSEKKQLTITTLYSLITEWLYRRYLRTHDNQILQLSKEDIEQRCEKELTFLESLAFNAMESNTIILRPPLLKNAVNEAKISSQEHPNILNIGILKSFHKQGIGNRIEMNKDHYFIHLSFQEYFAARYLINILNGSSSEGAIKFIKRQKYNQRYTLLFTFVSGLLSESYMKPCRNIFWTTILGEPIDLLGIRHIQLVIACIDEIIDKSTIPQHSQLLQWIVNCIENSIMTKTEIIRSHLSQSLQKAPSIASDETIINAFINLLQRDDDTIKIQVLSFISTLNISNPSSSMTTSIIAALGNMKRDVRLSACEALGKIGEKAETNEVIDKLVSALGDEYHHVRLIAREALEKIGKKSATNEVINKLVSALEDENHHVRSFACIVLGKICEKATMNEAINKLVSALGDARVSVRTKACAALWKIGEKAGTNEVINKLVSALGDEDQFVRMYACEALGKIGEKGRTNEVVNKLVDALGDERVNVKSNACVALWKIGEKAGTNEVINKLVSTLGDENHDVKSNACEALGKIGEKAGTNEVINKLVSALGDENHDVRSNACEALGNIGKKATTNEVINILVSALGDARVSVRSNACVALGRIGDKAATNEVINKLVSALGYEHQFVRSSACEALGNIGEKVATNEAINKLASALGDERVSVRSSACVALGKIGEKAGTNEVINKLVSSLGDEDQFVRMYACEALGNIGEKAATNEVINKLENALRDEDEHVGSRACVALGKIGKKAATNEAINKLVNALGDKKIGVRSKACVALGRIGDKAATNEVINKLVGALGDRTASVRLNAYVALGKIGEKAETNEVIDKLVSALGDEYHHVRLIAREALEKIGKKSATNEVINKLVNALEDERVNAKENACEALGKIGEKAATNEVINKLVNALEDERVSVRSNACVALGNIGEKAATNEVISKLMLLIKSNKNSYDAKNAIDNILSSFVVMIRLSPNIILDVLSNGYKSYCLKNVSEDQLMNFFLSSENSDWLPTVAYLALWKGDALTATEGKIVIYGKREALELRISSSQFRQQLVKVFVDQRERLRLSFTIPSDTENKS